MMSDDEALPSTATHARVTATERFSAQCNRFALTGIDHVGIPCRDPDRSGQFVERILGGVECFRAGYTAEERAAGRLRHIFYHVGSQLLEVVENRDPDSYPSVNSDDTNPHYSFGTTFEGVQAFTTHLAEEGIPFNGPRSHGGESVVSVYFRDLDGNNLEVCAWEGAPLSSVTPLGEGHPRVLWSQLAHTWDGGQTHIDADAETAQ